jgi:peptidoglycan/xylan/chitin deacetylase (PgdA/CDA1 family)
VADFVFLLTGLFWQNMRIAHGSRPFPVLLYHNVGAPKVGVYPEQTVSPARFEQHLAWLARHRYVAVRLRDWIDGVGGRRPSASRTVLITFDDGYAALAMHAFPLLLKYGLTACVFVVTDRLGKTNTWDEACGYESHRLLGRGEIEHWAARGIDFGAHGRTHTDLTTLSGAECEREVLGSRDELAEILGYAPLAFAYPYGRFNPSTVEVVRGAFRAAFSARRGVNTTGTDLHLLRRSLVHPRDSLLDLAFRVRIGVSPPALMRRVLQPAARLLSASRAAR